MTKILQLTAARIVDNEGNPAVNAKINVWASETTTPETYYQDSEGTIAGPNPLISDSNGIFSNIYLVEGVSYRIQATDSTGATVFYDVDPIDVGTIDASAVVITGGGDLQTELNSLDSRLDAIETVTPTSEGSSLALATALNNICAGPRDIITYVSAQVVKFSSKTAVMGGFRFLSQYTKQGRQPSFPISQNTASLTDDQGALSTTKAEAWYAVFAVADNGDASATIKVMPYLRLAAPVGNVAGLVAGGEGVTDLTTLVSHSWTADDNLSGTDCLVIHENKQFSGRTTTFTANSSTSVTLDDITGIVAGDFILPAPPGYDNYKYLGSFYRDTSEIRNIADSGNLVETRGINHATASASGSVASYVEINWLGYICPLASGIRINVTQSLTSGSTGELLQRIGHDSSNHDVWETYETKPTSIAHRSWYSGVVITFGQAATSWYQNAGSLAASSSSRQFEIRGWIEQ